MMDEIKRLREENRRLRRQSVVDVALLERAYNVVDAGTPLFDALDVRFGHRPPAKPLTEEQAVAVLLKKEAADE